jgi:hypothetical protein
MTSKKSDIQRNSWSPACHGSKKRLTECHARHESDGRPSQHVTWTRNSPGRREWMRWCAWEHENLVQTFHISRGEKKNWTVHIPPCRRETRLRKHPKRERFKHPLTRVDAKDVTVRVHKINENKIIFCFSYPIRSQRNFNFYFTLFPLTPPSSAPEKKRDTNRNKSDSRSLKKRVSEGNKKSAHEI